MKVVIAIDMGGTRIKVGLIRDGNIVVQSSVAASSHVTLHQRLNEIADNVDGMLKEHNAMPMGIGIAFPGIVDSQRGKVLSKYVKYPDAQKVGFSEWAAGRWNIPVAVENDAKAALLGEWRYGSGHGSSDLVLITLGTGVGSAVMMGGNLLSGRNFIAGNLGGHMTINVNGTTCNCGNIGCVETEGSTWALSNEVMSTPELMESSLSTEASIDLRAVFSHAAEGDRLAIRIREKYLKTWSLGVINMIHAFDPEKIVIGGGVMESRDVILPHINRMIAQHSWVKDNPPEIVAARHPQSAGLLGMYYLLTRSKSSQTT